MKPAAAFIALALAVTGCGSVGKNAEVVTVTSTSVKPLYGDELFAQSLRDGGILVTDEQVPSMVPLARTTCDTLENSTNPPDKRYAATVGVLQAIGKGKNIFEQPSTTRVFVDAAIAAYCPDKAGLKP